MAGAVSLEKRTQQIRNLRQQIKKLENEKEITANALKQFRMLMENTRDIILFIDIRGKILEANRAAIQAYGYSRPELLTRSIFELRGQDPLTSSQMEQAVTAGIIFQTVHYRKDGSSFPVEVSSQGAVIGGKEILLSLIRDITERKKIEEVLHQSEELFSKAFHASPVGISISELETGRILDVNNSFLNMLGYTRAETIGSTSLYLGIWPSPSQRTEFVQNMMRQSLRGMEAIFVTKSGCNINVLIFTELIEIRDKKCILLLTQDITQRKQVETVLRESEEKIRLNLRLQMLNKRSVTILEEERAFIARELHDEAGQALTALKIFLELIHEELPPQAEKLKAQLGEAMQLTAGTLAKIRNLAQNLRPPSLDALGLSLTLEHFCRDFGKRVGLSIVYQGCDLPALSDAVGICLYRFLQEGLTNVVKHANANQVQVRLVYHTQIVSLMIKDNGKGLNDDNEDFKSGKGMGLIGMQERLEMLGGNLEVTSGTGEGTTLIATIPWGLPNDSNLDSR